MSKSLKIFELHIALEDLNKMNEWFSKDKKFNSRPDTIDAVIDRVQHGGVDDIKLHYLRAHPYKSREMIKLQGLITMSVDEKIVRPSEKMKIVTASLSRIDFDKDRRFKKWSV